MKIVDGATWPLAYQPAAAVHVEKGNLLIAIGATDYSRVFVRLPQARNIVRNFR